ncbi:MAG TPA: hypothetical protein VGE83_04885 [Terracidiphilus sp.]|jgi:hypothetical protein
MLSGLFCACALLPAQPHEQARAQLTESGRIVVAGRSTPYLIRHLPVSSFPELPQGIQDLLNRRGCLIPQTYEAHHPENVVHASLERTGSSDWAVLCSVDGTVSLLVFFSGGSAQPFVLASAPENQRLQAHDPSGVLGFNWGIDPASPEQVREAQTGMEHRPARVDHDALADSVVDHRTIYHFYAKSAWIMLAMPD